MTKIQKKVEKLFRNPTSCKYLEIKEVLLHFGFEQITTKGSHVKYKHSSLRFDLIIPVHNNECKDFYKKTAKNKIEEIIVSIWSVVLHVKKEVIDIDSKFFPIVEKFYN